MGNHRSRLSPNHKNRAEPIDARPIIRTIRALRTMDLSKLKSRKLWATVIGTLLITIGTGIGISAEVISPLAAMISAYVIGQGIADHGAKGESQR